MSPEFIELLRCPETGQRLRAVPPEQVHALEARRCAGTLTFSASQPQFDLREPLEGALLREDGQVCYPIQHGIALLLADHALPC
jgi:uncharacterized protein YbaR (Trm112 family)